MYHTWINGKEFTTEQLQWVKQQSNGIYVSCSEKEGQGVILEGEIYHVNGRKKLDRPTVTLLWQEDTKKVQNTASLAFVALAQAQLLDDVTITEHPEVFEEWKFPVSYKRGQICTYRYVLYRCIRDHASQQDWTPEVAVSLWSVIGSPDEEWPVWAQPIGAYDVYMFGDKVSHMEKRWSSNTDHNVWEPGVYGWNEVTE